MNESGFFVAPIRWLLLQDRTILLDNSTENHESLDDAKIFNRMAIYPDSEVILVRKLRQDFAEISSVYRISRYHEVTTEDRGNWTLEEGVRIRDFQPTSRRRANLRSTPLTACLVVLEISFFVSRRRNFCRESIVRLNSFDRLARDKITADEAFERIDPTAKESNRNETKLNEPKRKLSIVKRRYRYLFVDERSRYHQPLDRFQIQAHRSNNQNQLSLVTAYRASNERHVSTLSPVTR